MIEFLAVGHLTVDRLATGITPGGSVSYASVTAARLGLRAAILTAAGAEIDWPASLPGIEIVRSHSTASTSFENRYEGGERIQRLLSLAGPVPPALLSREWRHTPIVHLAPVAHEVSGEFIRLFSASLLGLTPQGLLRYWDGDGVVRQGSWAGDDALLDGCGVVVLSEEDLDGDRDFLDRCIRRVPIVLLTAGAEGATMFCKGREEHCSAFPVEEVDPTGAGDVFAAAFLIEYNLTGDPRHSAAFACCAASFAVEAPGLSGIPDRAAVENRLALYRQMGD